MTAPSDVGRHSLDTLADLASALYLRQLPTLQAALGNIEETVYKALKSSHRKSVEESIAYATSFGLVDQKATIAAVESALGPELGAKVAPRMLSSMSGAYMASMESALASTRLTNFGVADTKAIQWLASDSCFWVGNSKARLLVTDADGWRAPLGQHIAERVKLALAEGYSTTQMGEVLKKEVGPLVNAPAVKGYWRGVAANATTRAASFGAVQGFRAAGVARYEWISVMDERTSEVCSQLDGTTFDVQHLLDTAREMMFATSGDDVKAAMPWVNAQDVATAKDAPDPESALKSLGVSAPPIHFHCRSTVVFSEFGPLNIPDVPPDPKPRPPDPKPLPPAPKPPVDYADKSVWLNPSKVKAGEVVSGHRIGVDGFAKAVHMKAGPRSGEYLSMWPTHAPRKTKDALRWVPQYTADTSGGRWMSYDQITNAFGAEARKAIRANSLTTTKFNKWLAKARPDKAKAVVAPTPAATPSATSASQGVWEGLGDGISAAASDKAQQTYFKALATRFEELVEEEAQRIANGMPVAQHHVRRAVKTVFDKFKEQSGGDVRGNPWLGILDNTTKTGALRTAMDNMAKDLSRLFSNDGRKALDLMSIAHSKAPAFGGRDLRLTASLTSSRQYVSLWERVIKLSRNKRDVNVHEYCHILEGRSRPLKKGASHRQGGGGADTIISRFSQKFLKRRTKGKPLQKLKDLTGLNYGPREVARDGGFIDAYIGKDYGHHNLSEVTSMGVEQFVSTNGGLALVKISNFLKKDPEHFGMTLALLMGRLKR